MYNRKDGYMPTFKLVDGQWYITTYEEYDAASDDAMYPDFQVRESTRKCDPPKHLVDEK